MLKIFLRFKLKCKRVTSLGKSHGSTRQSWALPPGFLHLKVDKKCVEKERVIMRGSLNFQFRAKLFKEGAFDCSNKNALCKRSLLK